MKLGDTVTRICQPVIGTLLRLFDLKCTTTLQKSTYKKHLPQESKKEDIKTFELNKALMICDPSPIKKGMLLRLPLRIKRKCPFSRDEFVTIVGNVQYGEATSPSNGIDSAVKTIPQSISEGSVYNQDFSTEAISTPWSGTFGSSGIGSCSLKLEVLNPDPDDTCADTGIKLTATLNSFGRAYDFLSGMTVVQEQTISCQRFIDGERIEGFWTGLAFPAGPIGIVMTLSYDVGF